MRIVIDTSRCEANGVCVRVAPELFRLDEQDRLHLLAGEVAPELRPQAEQAVRGCPRQALSLTKD
jgi:ferredoxin